MYLRWVAFEESTCLTVLYGAASYLSKRFVSYGSSLRKDLFNDKIFSYSSGYMQILSIRPLIFSEIQEASFIIFRETFCWLMKSSEHMVASPVIHLCIYGINPDIIRVLIKQFPEYMSVGWSPGWAHELVIDHARVFPLNFVKTVLKMGEVDFDTSEQYFQVSDANLLLISLLVDQFEKLDIWDSL